MPTLSDILSASIDGRSRLLRLEEASDLEGTRARIGRGRRIRVAATTSVGVVALAGVTSAAMMWGPTLLEPAGPQPGDTVAVTVDVSLAQSLGEDFRSTVPTCGDPAPTAVPSSQGFTLSVGEPANGLRTVTLSYAGPTYDSVTIPSSVGVLSQDGIVKAVLYDYAYADQYSLTMGDDVDLSGAAEYVNLDDPITVVDGLIRTTTTMDVRSALETWAVNCIGTTGASSAWSSSLPAGDYEYQTIQTVRRSALELALLELKERGYELAPTDGTWNPGSIDCLDAIDSQTRQETFAIPVECEAFGVHGVAFDGQGHVTLDYTMPQGEGDLNVTLVSTPQKVSFGQDVEVGSEIPRSYLDEVHEVALHCGALVESNVIYTDLDAELDPTQSIDSIDDFLAPSGVRVLLDTGTGSDVQKGRIDLPADATAWIVSQRGLSRTVVGSATASFDPSDSVPIDRSVGEAAVTVTLGEPTWCEISSDGAQAYLKTKSPDQIVIDGQFSAVPTSGRIQSEDRIILNWTPAEE